MSAKIIDVQHSDSDYDAAFQQARDSFSRLDDLWGRPYEGERNFMIKVCFEGTRRPIFLWLDLAEVRHDGYVGEVFETTEEVPALAEGQRLDVPRARALDWMVNDHGVVHGGFTLLVERRRLSGDSLAEFDDMLMAREWIDA